MTGAESSSMDVLRQEILADAEKQAERARRRAKRDAKTALEKAETEAAEDREARLKDARRRADTTRDLVLARVPVEARRMRADRQEAILRGIYEDAASRLADRDGFDYAEAVGTLAAEAIKRMDGDRFTLAFSAADRDAVAERVAEEVRRRVGREGVEIAVADESADIEAGVVVRDADGRQTWDNSLAARLERLWPELRRRIAGRLFSKGSPPPEES